jgi:hypothetical protein
MIKSLSLTLSSTKAILNKIQPVMPRKGFLDIPAEVRINIYGRLVPDIDALGLRQACHQVKSEFDYELVRARQKKFKAIESELVAQFGLFGWAPPIGTVLQVHPRVKMPQTWAEGSSLHFQVPLWLLKPNGYLCALLKLCYVLKPKSVQSIILEFREDDQDRPICNMTLMEVMDWMSRAVYGLVRYTGATDEEALFEWMDEYECDVENVAAPCTFAKLTFWLTPIPPLARFFDWPTNIQPRSLLQKRPPVAHFNGKHYGLLQDFKVKVWRDGVWRYKSACRKQASPERFQRYIVVSEPEHHNTWSTLWACSPSL